MTHRTAVRSILAVAAITCAAPVLAQDFLYRLPIVDWGERSTTVWEAIDFLNIDASNSLSYAAEIGDPAINFSSDLQVVGMSDGTQVDFTLVTPPAHGAVSGLPALAISAGGSLIPSGVHYTLDENFIGVDSFQIEASSVNANSKVIDVSVDIEKPKEILLSQVDGAGNLEYTVDIGDDPIDLSGDLEVIGLEDGDEVEFTVASAPTTGGLTGFPASGVSSGGALTPENVEYVLDENFSGTDEFQLLASSDGAEPKTVGVSVNILEDMSCGPWVEAVPLTNHNINGSIVASDSIFFKWNRIPAGVSGDVRIEIDYPGRYGNWTDSLFVAFSNNSGASWSPSLTAPQGNTGTRMQHGNITATAGLVTFPITQSDAFMLSYRPAYDGMSRNWNAQVKLEGQTIATWAYTQQDSSIDFTIAPEFLGGSGSGALGGTCKDGMFVSSSPEPLYMWNHTGEDINLTASFASDTGVYWGPQGGANMGGGNGSGNSNGYQRSPSPFGVRSIVMPSGSPHPTAFFTHFSQQESLPDVLTLSFDGEEDKTYQLPSDGTTTYRISGGDLLDWENRLYRSNRTYTPTYPPGVTPKSSLKSGEIRGLSSRYFRFDTFNRLEGDVDPHSFRFSSSMSSSYMFGFEAESFPPLLSRMAYPEDKSTFNFVVGSGPCNREFRPPAGC